MSKTLASHNPDLLRLLDKGYALAIDSNYLVVRDIPYLDAAGELKWSAFVGKMVSEDQNTFCPKDHQIYWAAPRPFGLDGQVIRGLGGGEARLELSEHCRDVVVRECFSHKLKEAGQLRPYIDHFEKIESYVAMVCGPAMAKFGVDPYTFRAYEEETPNSVFKLRDTMTSLAGISDLSKLFENDVIAIIGLGGSGSYLLDFMVKTPVREIRGFDSDKLFVHNTFRSPGRLDVDEDAELRKHKAAVYQNRYDNFRHGLTLKPLFIDETTAEELDGVTFAFVAVDKGSSRKGIIDLLIAKNIPFIDVGMGLKRHGKSISGMLRTTYFPRDAGSSILGKGYVPVTDPTDDVYKSNIQIAELNALNAALAVLRFKQIRGFYAALEHPNQLLMTLDELSMSIPDEN